MATPASYEAPLFADEAHIVARAVPKRGGEFRAGRAAARRGLRALGFLDQSIPTGARREPIWPAGIVGSITHCDGFCGAVVARQDEVAALGFDAEGADPLPARLVTRVCRADEIARHDALPAIAGVDWPKLTFSAKEAFYKAIFPLNQAGLCFHDAAVTLRVDQDGLSGDFEVAISPALPSQTPGFRGRWLVARGRIYTGVAGYRTQPGATRRGARS